MLTRRIAAEAVRLLAAASGTDTVARAKAAAHIALVAKLVVRDSIKAG
jgi:hypothetical protein